ncbi:MAG: DNA-processing protein DprA [Candidatus Electrothrix sp. GM3_4]|nr:DNA-processing protein DprA [Candidatus Electrothrix sp. GM3_4]
MMNDFLTEDTKAIILLCGVFGKVRSAKPLSLTEYSSLVRWLIGVKMHPEDLLQKENIPEASMGSGIDKQRLESLLGRGVQLGFAVEEWQRNGIWIISRSDADYPVRYKIHLKDKAPPLLFGVGNRSLLNGGGLGIVGSRNVDQEGEAFTRQVAELCAHNRMPVVSGGARGVDQISMTAALEAGGVTIGVLAENLLKKSVVRSARHAIADGRLLLLSPCHPNARFTVGTAMGRNKLIYAMADYGLVVSAEYKKGGTWAGATEELKRDNSRPLFVRTGSNVPPGNDKLLKLGAIGWSNSIEKENWREQLAEMTANDRPQKRVEQATLFNVNYSKIKKIGSRKSTRHTESDQSIIEESFEKISDSIYDAVLPVILHRLNVALSSDDLAKTLEVSKTQLNAWLKKAVEDGFIKKYSRPVRYVASKEARRRRAKHQAT